MQKIHDFDIWHTTQPIDDDLIDKIYRLKELDPGTPKTNQGGWHSKTFTPYKDYYNGRYKWTQHLIESLMAQAQQHDGSIQFSRAWFNMSYPGGTNRWHDHGEHKWVSVFYIKTPEPCSAIEFRKDTAVFVYVPKAGDFLVFPGSLEHRVLENQTDSDRISFAINFE
jgi:hypothetical protein